MDIRKVLHCALGLAFFIPVSLFGQYVTGWDIIYAPTTNDLTGVAYGNGTRVAVGRGSTTLVSSNGFQWRRAPNSFDRGSDFLSVAYGRGLFIAGGNLNSLRASSPDGVNWTSQATTTAGHRINSLVFAKGRFVGVGSGGLGTNSYIITSTDGLAWTFPTRPTSYMLNAVTYATNLFVAVGNAGTIITSPDGTNWTARSSGTQNDLRAVAYSGSQFVVAGDGGIALTSSDGASWSPGTAAPFHVNALAAGDDTVVAVGDVGAEGRIRAVSSLHDAQTYPHPLRDVMYVNGYLLAVGDRGLIVNRDLSQYFGNSWTKPISGKWEENFWSLGEPPARWQEWVEISNPGWKAVAIDANTVANYPNTLKLEWLGISAPADSQNLLLLNWAGYSVPLQVDQTIFVEANGSLLSYASLVQAAALEVRNRATFAEYSGARFGWVNVFGSNTAQLIFSNGTFSASAVTIGEAAYEREGDPDPGVFKQYGGFTDLYSLTIEVGGAYNMHAGSLDVRSRLNMYGSSRFNIAGGTVTAGWFLSSGEVRLAGGTLNSQTLHVNGAFNHTGGTHKSVLAEIAGSTYQFSSGVMNSSDLKLGMRGTFVQSGGVHTNSRLDFRWRSQWTGLPPTPAEAGVYTLNGGSLVTDYVDLNVGTFSQTAGTNRMGLVEMSRSASFSISGGELYSSNLIVGIATEPGAGFSQSGGKHAISEGLMIADSGFYQLNGGILSARNIQVGSLGKLLLPGGDLQNNEQFILSGGRVEVAGPRQFGVLLLSNTPCCSTVAGLIIPSDLAAVRFRDSHAAPWDPSSWLPISYWSGTTNGGNGFRIYVGSNAQGLTTSQLRQIVFVNPIGFPSGIYSAQILATGELVPGRGPALNYSRSRSHLVLNWPEGCSLMTSTNVTGPWQYLMGTSPYTNAFTDPKRFFLIRSP